MFSMAIKTARGDLRLLGGGESALLLSHQRLPGNDPAVPRASQPPQFARSDFQDTLARCHIFHDKGPFDASAANIPNHPFRLNQFIQLPSTQLLRRPHLVLAPHAVVQLIVPVRHTAVVKNACSGLHRLSHCTSNGNRVVGVRLGKVEHLNTLVFSFIPIGHDDLIWSELLDELMDHGSLDRRQAGGISQWHTGLLLEVRQSKLKSRLCSLLFVTRIAASTRFETRSEPPLTLGMRCSTCKGRPVAPQYEHVRFHFRKRYSRTK